jgi:4'-phosphopantetheinyl transferase EntD
VTLADSARALFPPGVRVAGGAIADWQGPPTGAEAQAVKAAVPARRAAFAAGRTAARAALGLPGADLPRHPDGPPVWPQGWTGSISHTGDTCLAAVAPTGAFAALGLDIDRSSGLAPDLVAEVLTPDEQTLLAGRDPTVFFCAKEAAYKAQFTLTRRLLGFHDVTITGPAASDNTLVLQAAGLTMTVHLTITNHLIIAATALPP